MPGTFQGRTLEVKTPDTLPYSAKPYFVKFATSSSLRLSSPYHLMTTSKMSYPSNKKTFHDLEYEHLDIIFWPRQLYEVVKCALSSNYSSIVVGLILVKRTKTQLFLHKPNLNHNNVQSWKHPQHNSGRKAIFMGFRFLGLCDSNSAHHEYGYETLVVWVVTI